MRASMPGCGCCGRLALGHDEQLDISPLHFVASFALMFLRAGDAGLIVKGLLSTPPQIFPYVQSLEFVF